MIRAEIYFAIEPNLNGIDLLIYYKARFQIEFLYRDAKQFAQLQDFQSRKTEQLHFHFNASLTLVSLAKALHYLTIPIEQRKTFVLSSIKMQYSNQHFLVLFFACFKIYLNRIKIILLIYNLLTMAKLPLNFYGLLLLKTNNKSIHNIFENQ